MISLLYIFKISLFKTNMMRFCTKRTLWCHDRVPGTRLFCHKMSPEQNSLACPIMKLQRNFNARKRRKVDFELIIKSGRKNIIGLPIAPGTRRKQNVKYVLKRLLWRMTVLMLLNLTSDLKSMGSVCRQ